MLEYFIGSHDRETLLEIFENEEGIFYELNFDVSNPVHLIFILEELKTLEIKFERMIELLDAEQMMENRLDQEFLDDLDDEVSDADTLREVWEIWPESDDS